MQNFRELKVWVRAHELTLAVYRATAEFPRHELFGLTSQIRRSAASIAANIAEGCGRSGKPELARFCSLAAGSASELQYHLLLAKDLKMLKIEDYRSLAPRAAEVERMLGGLRKKLVTSD